MTHLSESEFVDFASDALDPRRAAHVETCASCREQSDVLRAMLRDVSSVVVPEPSPLFWEHMSARVRDGVAAAPVPSRFGWRWPGIRSLVPIGAAAAVAVAVISGALMLRTAPDGRPSVPVITEHAAATAAPDATPRATPDPDNAEVWDVLTSAASTIRFDEAHAAGMHVHPAAIDHAVQGLSAAERNELGRLLQSELKRSSD
jgi:hypothetical protein